jgi:DNA-binding XRE family transcriptional regulator
MTKPPSNAHPLPGLNLMPRVMPPAKPTPPPARPGEDPQQFIGRQLCIARELSGLTQKEAGEAVGLNASTITNIEVGKYMLSLRALLSLALLYDVEPGSLLPGLESLT